MSRSLMHRAGSALILAGIAAACGGRTHSLASTQPVPAAASTVDRMLAVVGRGVGRLVGKLFVIR